MAKQKMDGFLTSFMQDLIDRYVDRKSDKTNEIISNGIEEVDNMSQLLFSAVQGSKPLFQSIRSYVFEMLDQLAFMSEDLSRKAPHVRDQIIQKVSKDILS